MSSKVSICSVFNQIEVDRRHKFCLGNPRPVLLFLSLHGNSLARQRKPWNAAHADLKKHTTPWSLLSKHIQIICFLMSYLVVVMHIIYNDICITVYASVLLSNLSSFLEASNALENMNKNRDKTSFLAWRKAVTLGRALCFGEL